MMIDLDKEYLFKKELLKNTSLQNLENWNNPKNIQVLRDNLAEVSLNSPISQRVNVNGGGQYLSAINVICPDQITEARNQVNWYDINNRFIKADITVFQCRSISSANESIIIAPANASVADIYATSHTKIPVKLISLSFRQ